MTRKRGKAYCDNCGNVISAQTERIDCYKRKLKSLRVYKHYCKECFEKQIEVNDAEVK